VKKNTLNYIVNAASFVVLLFLSSTGLLLHFVLPPGSGRKLAVWEMGRHDWGEIHLILAFIILALMVVHLLLHWSWIHNTTKHYASQLRGFSFLGLIGLLIVIGFSIAPFLSSVENSNHYQGKHKRGYYHHD
jgi:FtsH-binding integral membrane protein